MREKRKADYITHRYVPVFGEDGIELTLPPDGNGVKWRTVIDTIVGLGRHVTAYTVDGEVIKEKYLSPQHPFLDPRRPAAMQSWAERQVESMRRRYGTSDTRVYSDFASRLQRADAGQTVFEVGYGIPLDELGMYMETAKRLTAADLGKYVLKINTDIFKNVDHGHVALLGVTDGDGRESAGPWMPFYDVVGITRNAFESNRTSGMNHDKALDEVPFDQIISRYQHSVAG